MKHITFNRQLKTVLFLFLFSLGFTAYSQTLVQKFYIDFGQDNPSQSRRLSGVDANGNHWNNVVAPIGSPSTLNAGASVTLKSSTDAQTFYVLEVARSIRSNGGDNGGLFTPDPALLGDLAVATATEDYFFLDGGMGKGLFKFKSLDRNKAYKFYIFGTRVAAGAQRGVIYSLSGKNGSHGSQLNTGTGIGDNGYNGNNNNVWESAFVIPADNGEIMLELGRLFSDQMGYISAMKIEEYSDVEPVEVEKKFFIDFGKNNNGLDGAPTTSPDINGNHWNNVYSNGNDWSIGASDGSGNLTLKSSDNSTTDYKLEMASEVRFNGVRNGALGGNDSSNEPKSELIGELAIRTATYDYLFIENSSQTAVIHFKNLNRGKQYRFNILGSRTDSGTEGRVGRIELKGGNTIIGIHQMGGAGIGAKSENYNNKNVFVSDPVIPDVEGKITLTMTTWLGYAHINCIKLEELPGEELPTATDISISGGNAIGNCGGFLQLAVTAVPQGALLPFVTWSVDDENLARITEAGRLYAKSNGTVTVTATADFGDDVILTKTREIVITNQNISDYSFTVMGSSVPWGQGASPRDQNGYAWLWTTYLKQKGEYNWTTNNISIGGNTTTDVTNRWDSDLLPSCSRYVFYGLSLGNEGIHERGVTAYNSWRDNMLALIDRARAHGKEPIVGNNYPRGDFNATDYNYLKNLNLLIHQWDVASVNLLGSIDNGAGQWASGYIADNAHPNTAGHAEMFYSIVPSLVDAMAEGKPQPVRNTEASLVLEKGGTIKQLSFIPENILHPFTLAFSFKTTDTGTLASVITASGDTVRIRLNDEGKLTYKTQTSETALNDGVWHTVALTHYYAWGRTQLYVDGERIPRSTMISEKVVPKKFILNEFGRAPESATYRELFLFRSGMCAEEIVALHEGKMLKSSLEIYAPLDGGAEGNAIVENKAQSLNTLTLEEQQSTGVRNMILSDKDRDVKEVTVYSLAGQQLFRTSEVNSDYDRKLSKGVYIVRAKTIKGDILTQKIVVE